MFNDKQLTILCGLESKWQVWKQSQVSLFTHEDKLRIDEVRAAMGLGPANINCNACFMEDIGVVMNAYEQQKNRRQHCAGRSYRNQTGKDKEIIF